MAWLDRLLQPRFDKYAAAQGYVKQSAISRRRPLFSASRLLSGETHPGDAMNLYADWSAEEFQKLAITNPVVYRDVFHIGRVIGQAELFVEERTPETETGWTKVNGHHYTRIMEQFPNPIMGQSFLWLYQVAWILIDGEAYWLLVDDSLGDLRQVYPLPANRVQPIPNTSGNAQALPDIPRTDHPLLGYAYTPISGQEPEILLPHQVCYDRLPNLFGYFRGMSPISAYLVALKLYTEGQLTSLEDFQNRLKLKHLISVPPETGDGEYDIVLADLLEQEELGLQWKLIRGGDTKVDTIKRDRSDNNLDVFKLTEHQIDGIYGFPDGFWQTAGSNRSTSEEHKATLIDNTIWPLMTMLAENQTGQVIVPRHGENSRARFEDIRPTNRELALKETDSARESQTYNEARKAEGGDPHPDPDVGLAPFASAGPAYELKLQSRLGLMSPTIRPTATPLAPSPPVTQSASDNGFDFAARAQARDLKRWKSVAVRQARRNKSPAEYEFESDHISEYKAYLYRAFLDGMTDVAHIKALFSAKNGAFDAADIYIQALRGLIEQAQAGDLAREEFIDQADTIISTELEGAFLKGAEADGISDEEQEEIQDEIDSALGALPELADDVFAGKFVPEDDDTPAALALLPRLALWGSAALGLYSIGRTFKFADELLIWLFGPTEHGTDCLRLNGQIHTGKDWRASGWRPQGRNLECGGWNCLCVLIPAPDGSEAAGGF